ncbi:hypothetical protein ACFLY7_00715 [Patescibacteria group bacterium]
MKYRENVISEFRENHPANVQVYGFNLLVGVEGVCKNEISYDKFVLKNLLSSKLTFPETRIKKSQFDIIVNSIIQQCGDNYEKQVGKVADAKVFKEGLKLTKSVLKSNFSKYSGLVFPLALLSDHPLEIDDYIVDVVSDLTGLPYRIALEKTLFDLDPNGSGYINLAADCNLDFHISMEDRKCFTRFIVWEKEKYSKKIIDYKKIPTVDLLFFAISSFAGTYTLDTATSMIEIKYLNPEVLGFAPFSWSKFQGQNLVKVSSKRKYIPGTASPDRTKTRNHSASGTLSGAGIGWWLLGPVGALLGAAAGNEVGGSITTSIKIPGSPPKYDVRKREQLVRYYQTKYEVRDGNGKREKLKIAAFYTTNGFMVMYIDASTIEDKYYAQEIVKEYYNDELEDIQVGKMNLFKKRVYKEIGTTGRIVVSNLNSKLSVEFRETISGLNFVRSFNLNDLPEYHLEDEYTNVTEPFREAYVHVKSVYIPRIYSVVNNFRHGGYKPKNSQKILSQKLEERVFGKNSYIKRPDSAL